MDTQKHILAEDDTCQTSIRLIGIKKVLLKDALLIPPIQGTAADILKIAITKILKGLSERIWLKPILQIHDELVVELPKEKLSETINFMKKCMEEKPFDNFDVPLIAEASFGKTFGKLKEIEVMGSGN